ncbi:hypothetical protein G6F32_016462 [Rhizopus arrhizus]|nr:hypothetical protein G6F32_016462 [Rhizopus arrhizus]
MRHPYLRAGRTAEERVQMDAFFKQHGYRVAPVTVDNARFRRARGDAGTAAQGLCAVHAEQAGLLRKAVAGIAGLCAAAGVADARQRAQRGHVCRTGGGDPAA